MKKIILAGGGSYIGSRLTNWLGKWPGEYAIHAISLRTDDWRQADFSGYDAIFYAAGIAHQKETANNEALYYQVNRDLTWQVARKARDEGVPQFLFLSSMSVYGMVTGVIDEDTMPKPNTHYGKSKLAAEALLTALENERFHVAVLRPPMVYGAGCKGNFPRLASAAKKVPLFPRCRNKRSMVYVDNLCEAARLLIDAGGGGLYFPQDRAYANTGALIQQIAGAHGRHVALVPGADWLLDGLARRGGTWGKVFGSLYYDQAMSEAPHGYRVFTQHDAVRLTETEARS